MKHSEIESFPAYVASKLKTYVYRLIDPRNGDCKGQRCTVVRRPPSDKAPASGSSSVISSK
jgi:hypothetical protein